MDDDEEVALKTLQDRLAQLGLEGHGEGDEAVQTPPKVLEELTLEGVVKHIQKLKSSDNSKKIQVHFAFLGPESVSCYNIINIINT